MSLLVLQEEKKKIKEKQRKFKAAVDIYGGSRQTLIAICVSEEHILQSFTSEACADITALHISAHNYCLHPDKGSAGEMCGEK